MDKKSLEQYRDCKASIELIEEQIRELSAEKEKYILHDIVKGSHKEYPYTEKTFHVDGVPYSELEAEKIQIEIDDITLNLKRRRYECFEAYSQVEKFIASVEEEHLRLIFTYRYIKGLTWQEIATKIGGGNTESAVKMAHNRYLEKL